MFHSLFCACRPSLVVVISTVVLIDCRPAFSQIRISEFVASNETGLIDDDGYVSDWIEIHNESRNDVNLAGWSITDVEGQPKKWVFPEIEVKPDERLVIFASSKDRRDPEKPLHTNFGLKASGEFLGIFNPEGRAIDQYSPLYPSQRTDLSYGIQKRDRHTDRFAAWKTFLAYPTPGRPNTFAWQGTLQPISVSVPRGLISAPFRLKLTSPDPETQIRYTTDGSQPTETNGSVYEKPIHIATTTIIRSAAFKRGYTPSAVETHSYIFIEDVMKDTEGLPPAGYPIRWGRGPSNYGLDPRMTQDPEIRAKLIKGLTSIPTFSLTADVDDFFSDEKGIYAHAGWHGRKAERVCSIELIYPDDYQGIANAKRAVPKEVVTGFQINCGARIRGGFSRNPRNTKHGLRFFFRRQYGTGRLRYPLFGDDAAQDFDHFDLRCAQNYSWHSGNEGYEHAAYVRDQVNRDLQLAMGHPGARGDYYHLYMNGHYWGVFNSCERAEASFGASYLGGDKEDYDVIKVLSGFTETGFRNYNIFPTDGVLKDWARLYELASRDLSVASNYRDLIGVKKDGARKKGVNPLLDPVNLIDYMLVIFYAGNLDAPVTHFGANQGGNNWYAIRNRVKSDGFKFFIWDAEHTLLNVNEDRIGPFPAGNNFEKSNPQWIFQRCLDNAEFRMLLADRIQKQFHNQGVLTPEFVSKTIGDRAGQIELALLAEAARWGDSEKHFNRVLAGELRAIVVDQVTDQKIDKKRSSTERASESDSTDSNEETESGKESKSESSTSSAAEAQSDQKPKPKQKSSGEEADRSESNDANSKSENEGGAAGEGSSKQTPADRDDKSKEKLLPLGMLKYVAWKKEIDRMQNEYVPRRTAIVLQQLWSHGFIPEFPQVRWTTTSDADKVNLELTLSEPANKAESGNSPQATDLDYRIYYTLDGADPREFGGAKSKTARRFSSVIRADKNSVVRFRLRLDDEWGPLYEIEMNR